MTGTIAAREAKKNQEPIIYYCEDEGCIYKTDRWAHMWRHNAKHRNNERINKKWRKK